MKTYTTSDMLPIWEFRTILETQIIPQEKEVLRKEIHSYRVKKERTYISPDLTFTSVENLSEQEKKELIEARKYYTTQLINI